MKSRDLAWLGAFAGDLAAAVPGGFGSSRHRKARMLRFAFRSGGRPLQRKLVLAQQRHEVARAAERHANRLKWLHAKPVDGAPKKPKDRKRWKRGAACRP